MTLIGMPPKKLALDVEKIPEFAGHNSKMNLEAKQGINHAFEIPRGGTWLN